MSPIAQPSSRQSRIPAMVMLVCLPLPALTALGQFARALETVNERAFIMIGFASALGYVVTFLPALLLFEPFAIGASVWYTHRCASRDNESFGGLIMCWAAVLVHSITLAFYLRTGWR
jgi:hypothetical protein